MKKIYNSPKVLVVLLDTQEMICASDPTVSINKDGSVEAASVESRRGSFWDDEEE